MAQKVEVLLIDDLDGGSADESVTFSLDGFSYEIDLSEVNAEALRDILDPYVHAARRLGGRLRTNGRKPKPAIVKVQADTPTIRAWAASQPDITISDRGRIPQAIIDRYNAAEA